ncbi:MAG: tetratricopeptide repeat protein [Gemmatimonadota bacterium]|nr:MAG: tetratricopeptide repeat protein [Gemmatimonadota bacterium]
MAVLWLACACHSPLWAQEQPNLRDHAYRHEVLERIDSLIESKYVLPDRAGEYAEGFRSRYASGAYDSYTDPGRFAEKVTADLIEITGDSHFYFRVIEASDLGESTESSLHHPVRLSQLGKRENLGFFRLEWLEGNVGYLDLRRFYPISESKEMVDAAMSFLSGANAIIIDVRENRGGAGESLPYICSHFLPYPTQLTSWYSRENDFLKEYWTSEEIAGDRRTDVPLFLLTSERTFSAAEMFAYDLQVRTRATLVGESTGGGAHSVDLYQIDDQFEIYIPTARAINPVTSGNWEGTGIVPDLVVPSEAAFDTAVHLARAAAESYGAAKESRLRVAVDRMQILLDDVETLYRAGLKGEAAAALDSVFQIGDQAGLINEFFVDVLSYNYFGESDEQILYAVLNKKVEFFPESPTAWEALADAYAANGRNALAVECYEKVLELDPENRNAAKWIERLTSGDGRGASGPEPSGLF